MRSPFLLITNFVATWLISSQDGRSLPSPMACPHHSMFTVATLGFA